MNFDCMDIFPVGRFEEFNSSIDDLGQKARGRYGYRQKMLLYSLDGGGGLLEGGGELRGLPLIALTVLDIATDPAHRSEQEAKCRECLRGVLSKASAGGALKGEVMGSLSIYDHILVLRGDRYAKIDAVLADCRKALEEAGIQVNKMYTTAGIDLGDIEHWTETGLKVSIRLSCTSKITPERLQKDPQIQKALTKYQVYSILGKYDLDIIGEIQDNKEFVKLFLDNGCLSSENSDVHSSNTRFLNLYLRNGDEEHLTAEEAGHGSGPEGDRAFSEQDDEDLKEYMDRYEEIKGLSSGIREALLRLILRTFQASAAISDREMTHIHKQILEDFLDFLRIHQDEDEMQEEFAQMINVMNLLLDNRVSAGMADFETPQNVLRYSGSSLKVLLKYSGFVGGLKRILTLNKEAHGQDLEYVLSVTADTGAKITATVYLSYCKKYRFININIPVDLIFDIRYVIPWLTHEVGHFIRAEWTRRERNAAYHTCINRAVMHLLRPYMGDDLVPVSERSDLDLTSLRGDTEAGDGRKFDLYRSETRQFYEAVIYRSVFDHSYGIKVPYSAARELYGKMERITTIMQNVFEESIADIFMIRVLDITDLDRYLCIQKQYFDHINVSVLAMENVSRILAVCAVMMEVDPKDHAEMGRRFSSYFGRVTGELKPLTEQLGRYDRYYLLEPLIIFLQGYVVTGLNKLLAGEKAAEICQKLREGYRLLSDDTFEGYLQFLDLS